MRLLPDDANTLTTLSPSGNRKDADPDNQANAPARRKATVGITPLSIAGETRELLRDRVRIVSAIIALGVALFVVRDLLAEEGSYLPWVRVVLVATFGGLTIWLRAAQSMTLDGLRRLEIVMVWLVSGWFAIDRFHYIHDGSASGDAAATVFALAFAVLEYVLVITAYSIFIPNTWQRALRLSTPLALLPGLIVGLVLGMYPADAATLWAVLTPMRVTSLSLMLVIALLFSAGGARLIHAL